MEKKANKPTTMRFTSQDKEFIERVKELYGCPSDSAAIRLALRMVAREEIIPSPAPKCPYANNVTTHFEV
jgi:hypothetical protein